MTEKKEDVLDEYFECLTECDLADEECTDECLIELKENDTPETK